MCPWIGKNALDAAIQCYNNISMLRQQMQPGCSVHGIIVDGGAKPNIIPKRSELHYYIRGQTCKTRDELKEKVLACAEAAAASTGEYNSLVFLDSICQQFTSLNTNSNTVSLIICHQEFFHFSVNDRSSSTYFNTTL